MPTRNRTYPETVLSVGDRTGPRTRYTPRIWSAGISLSRERYTLSPSENATLGCSPFLIEPMPVGRSGVNSPARTNSSGVIESVGFASGETAGDVTSPGGGVVVTAGAPPGAGGGFPNSPPHPPARGGENHTLIPP